MRCLTRLACLLLLSCLAPAHAGGLNGRPDADKTNSHCQQPVKDAAGRPVKDAMGRATTADCPAQGDAAHAAVPPADRR